MRLIIYDCEVFKYDWLVVLKDHESGQYTVVHNDNEALKACISEDCIYVGFNSKHYDQFIIKAIWLGCNPQEIKALNDFIIGGGQGWEYPLMRENYLAFNNVDIMDDVQRGLSLKAIEGHLNMDIQETEVSFDLDRPLTEEELLQTTRYCMHDVDATDELMVIRKDYLKTKLNLGKRAGIGEVKSLSSTNAKLTAMMLRAKRREWNDGRDYVYPKNLDISVIPQPVLDFFETIHDMSIPDETLFKTSFEITIGGMPCKYAWGGVHGKQTCSEAWESVKSTASEKWASIKTDVLETVWGNIKTDAGAKFEEVRQKVSDTWDNINRDAPGKWEEIKVSIKGKWDEIVSSAKSWGSDLCSNLASGIESGVDWVKNAARGVADKVSQYLHFSEPDVGPLSNFHTYMPDMLKLMAEGIRSNTGLAVNAVYDLANDVSNAINSVPLDNATLPVEENLAVRYAVDTTGSASTDYESNAASTMQVDNSQLISALYAVASQIITAINEKDTNFNVDGKQLLQTVEKQQRQRGANIMRGGVLQ